MMAMSFPILKTTVDRLTVTVYSDRNEMGAAAANHTAELIQKVIEKKGHVRMIFAAAPSQNEFLAQLTQNAELDWSRVTAFHMDEYVGLPSHHPARFVKYLDEHIFNVVRVGEVHRIQTLDNPEDECSRYGRLITANPIDIVCLGIGENGHIAFNDPAVADFQDREIIKVVELDETCRMQQVHDGCFSAFDEVPKHAVTVTIPTLLSAAHMVSIVPGPSKRDAVSRTLTGPITEDCPASILRTHSDCAMFVDSAAYGVN
ncbi:glucosamine-6-phosphate deaminase [Alicyclobacillus curvatus]|jgi:glucosamine-6-phosphate deaminase|nr:glucosamine-6-phosphate deaminase [Alicyclobacillus curvatus]